MLKSKILGRKIRNIIILLMVIIIAFGTYSYIRNSRAENIVKISATAIDNYRQLQQEEFLLDAREISDGLFEIEIPEAVNSKKVNKVIRMTLGNEILEFQDDKVVLTQEQIDSAKISLNVEYDVQIKEEHEDGTFEKILLSSKTAEEIKQLQITEETEVLYNKILRYEDTKNGKEVEVKGFLPKDAELQVEEVSQKQLTDIFGDTKIDVAYDIKIIRKIVTQIPADEANPDSKPEEIVETIEINPEDFSEKCEVSIKDSKIKKDSQVFHVKDDNTYEEVNVIDSTKENISFEAETFSIYAVIQSALSGITGGASTYAIDDNLHYVEGGLGFSQASTTNGTATVTVKNPYTDSNHNNQFKQYGWGTGDSTSSVSTWHTINENDKFSIISITSPVGLKGKGMYLHIKLTNTTDVYHWGQYKSTYGYANTKGGNAGDGLPEYYFKENGTTLDGATLENNKETWRGSHNIKLEFGGLTISSTGLRVAWSTSSEPGDDDLPAIDSSLKDSKGNFTIPPFPTNVENGEDEYYYLRVKMFAKPTSGSNLVRYTSIGPFKVDTKAPTFDASGSNGTLTVSNAKDSGSGLPSAAYRYNGGSWTSSKTTTYTSAGTIKVEVRDNAGNIATKNVSVTAADTTPPTFTYTVTRLDGEGVENWANQQVKFNINATDSGSGVKEIQYSYDQSSWTTLSDPVWTAERNQTVYFRVVDNAENYSSVKSDTIKIDKTVPTAPTLSANPSGDWVNKDVTVTISGGADPNGSVKSGFQKYYTALYNSSGTQISGSRKDYTSTTATRTITASELNSAGGQATLKVWTYDKANNYSTEATKLIKIDNTAPTPGTLTMKLNSSTGSNYTSGWTNNNVYLAINSQGSDSQSGVASTNFTIKKGSTTVASNQTTYTLKDTGEYSIVVTTTDKAGNTASSSTYTVQIDKTNPTVGTVTMKKGSSTGATYSSGTWTNQSVYVQVSNGSDGTGQSGHNSTTFTIDGKTISGSTTTVTDTGTHTLKVTTTDKAGNTATADYTIMIDKTNPTAGTLTMKLGSASGSNYTNNTTTSQNVYIYATAGSDGSGQSGHASTTYSVNRRNCERNRNSKFNNIKLIRNIYNSGNNKR